jgi:peroxiredoxin
MTTTDTRAKIELGLNIVIAVAIVLIAGVVVKRTFFPEQVNRPTLEQQAQMLLGTRINVPGADWAQNKKSLVFFLKKDCIYCDAIAPAYRELISEAQKLNVKLIAILPNSVEEGRQYVQALGLSIDDVQMGSLSSYKMPGTPSVLMVDGEGTIRGIWIGAEPGRDREMREKLVSLL